MKLLTRNRKILKSEKFQEEKEPEFCPKLNFKKNYQIYKTNHESSENIKFQKISKNINNVKNLNNNIKNIVYVSNNKINENIKISRNNTEKKTEYYNTTIKRVNTNIKSKKQTDISKKYDINTPIDIILLWTNMNDKKWIKNYAKYNNVKDISHARYTDYGELELSLFTINKFMPWIRKIFIITECKLPDYTKKYKNIISIHQDVILQNSPALRPNFNSNVIESLFYKIPELSEIFLFGCDDYFVGSYIPKSYWFNSDWTKPRCNLRGINFPRPIKSYWHYMNNSNSLVKNHFKTNLNIDIVPTHQISLLTKKSCEHAWKLFEKPLIKLCKTRIRVNPNIQITSHLLFQLVGLNIGEIDIHIEKGVEFHKSHPFGTLHYDGAIKNKNGEEYKKFLKNLLITKPDLFCLNHLNKENKDKFYIFKNTMMKNYKNEIILKNHINKYF